MRKHLQDGTTTASPSDITSAFTSAIICTITYYGYVFYSSHGKSIRVPYSTLSSLILLGVHGLMECGECLLLEPSFEWHNGNFSVGRVALYSMTVSPQDEIWGDPAPGSLAGINQGGFWSGGIAPATAPRP